VQVRARFAVDTSGCRNRFSILKSSGPYLDSQLIRILKVMPSWQPAKKDGAPVNVWYTLPVLIDIDGE
jgi:Gram-negative bacterial TonB protein C-terminal